MTECKFCIDCPFIFMMRLVSTTWVAVVFRLGIRRTDADIVAVHSFVWTIRYWAALAYGWMKVIVC